MVPPPCRRQDSPDPETALTHLSVAENENGPE